MLHFVDYNTAKKLNEQGFKEKTLFVYGYKQTIRLEIREKYGELSDDGYYELTKAWGGKLRFNQVYYNELVIVNREHCYYLLDENKVINAPTIEEVKEWLRKEKNIHVSTDIKTKGFKTSVLKYAKNNTQTFNVNVIYTNKKHFNTSEESEMCAIKYILRNKMI